MATWGRNKKTTIQTICGTDGCGNPLDGSTSISLENGKQVLICRDCADYLADVQDRVENVDLVSGKRII